MNDCTLVVSFPSARGRLDQNGAHWTWQAQGVMLKVLVQSVDVPVGTGGSFRGFSRPSYRTPAFCMGRQILYHCTTWESHTHVLALTLDIESIFLLTSRNG